MSFFFSFLSSLVFPQIERERERRHIIGYREKQSYSLLIFSDGFLWRIFSLLRAGEVFKYIYLWLEGMGTSCPGFYFAPLPGVLALDSPHLFTTTSVRKLIFLFPTSVDGRSSLFRLRVLANHLASNFFPPLSGDSLGLLYVPVSHSLPIRSPSTNICLFPFWPGFVTLGLTYIISLNGHSLTAC